MKLIGINGFKGSGKDTTYSALKYVQEREHNWFQLGLDHAPVEVAVERRAFADKLKVMAALSLGYEGPDTALIALMDRLKEGGFVDSVIESGTGTHQTGRKYLQNFGQHARRVFGSNFWVDQVLPLDGYDRAKLWEYPDGELPAYGVVTDVRYPNEAERIQELGGVIWEVVRPGTESDGHSSEKPLPRDLIDVVIQNGQDRTALAARVEIALEGSQELFS